MATIVTRIAKGSPLTASEVDSNFINLNSDKLDAPGNAISVPLKATSTDLTEPAYEVLQADSGIAIRTNNASIEVYGAGVFSDADVVVGQSGAAFGQKKVVINSQSGVNGGSLVQFVNGVSTHLVGHGGFSYGANDLSIVSDSGRNIRLYVGNTEVARVSTTFNVGINTILPSSKLHVEGPIALAAPVQVDAVTYTVTDLVSSVIFHTTNCSVTLPSASSCTGRILYFKNRTANSVVSASSDVKPLNSDTAGTAILSATAGKFAMLQSDGSNWVIMMAN
jgi:hypothetical protein